MMQYLYWAQLTTSCKLQEPIPLDQWTAGQTESTPISISSIDRTPVSFIHPLDDEDCPIEDALRTYGDVTSPGTTFRIIAGDHGAPVHGGTKDFVGRMLQTIETGTVAKQVSVSPGD